jgi:type IV secretory pathway TrbD component
MTTESRPEGLEVPVHRSLVGPMLLVGLPRKVALVLWTTVSAFAFGLRQVWVLPLGVVLHVACAAAVKADPHFFEIIVEAIKHGRRMEP